MTNKMIDVEAIYERIADKHSRAIFDWRYAYYKNGDLATLYRGLVKFRRQTDIHHLPDGSFAPDMISFLESPSLRANGVILYGAGVLLSHCINYMKAFGVEIKAICDTHKHGSTYGEYPIISLEEAMSLRGDSSILITTIKEQYLREMKQAIIAHGVGEGSIFISISPAQAAFNYMLQYFPMGIMAPRPEEVFIDAGCLDGETILLFRKFSGDGGYRRIYGFEPHAGAFEATAHAMRENEVKNVTLINKGLWSAAETLRFESDNSCGGAGITLDGDTTIETVRLDDAVDINDRVTFIKMDIEGAELNALRGASGIIQRDKPRLAICVYHKPEDIVEIPSYILSLNPEYKLYLRHHSFGHWETVLYAI